MWSILKYCVDAHNQNRAEPSEPEKELSVDLSSENMTKTIEDYIKNYTENYLITLHYLDFPVIFCYTNLTTKIPETDKFKKLNEYLEPVKEVQKILLQNKADAISGMYFIRKKIEIQQEILLSTDQETFDRRASQSGLEPYVINDLRMIWKNSRLEYLQKALARHVEQYYKPDTGHPLWQYFVKFLEDTFKRGVDRFKTFICIGSTYIGKSVFFNKFVIPEQYYISHSNYLEYSKMPDQPHKVFRILDDIHWDNVTSTELKALLNRNISSVNIKYGYEYIFPLIPIIIMNGEDYKTFRSHFADIWEFIERNAVIYPPQGKQVIEEKTPLFTNEILRDGEEWPYLFNEIMKVTELVKCDCMNMNEWIKNELDKKESWKYDTKKYIQIPEMNDFKIPNPDLDKKAILKDYENYILRKKQKEMAEEKKPKPVEEPWYKRQGKKEAKKRTTTKFDDLDDYEDMSEEDEEYDKYDKKRRDDDSEDSESLSETGMESDSDSSEDMDKGFVEL